MGRSIGLGDSILRLLAILIRTTNIICRLKLAFIRGFTLHQSSPANGDSFLRRNLFVLGLVEIAGAAVIERIVGIVVFFLGLGPGATLEGVVVPAFDDHLSEEDEGNGV
jgi:hypothetical protein